MDTWLEIKRVGEYKPNRSIITDAIMATGDQTRPYLPENECNELNRLTARWVAKCGRPQAIVNDEELQQLVSRMLELCKAKMRYYLPAEITVARHLQLLGAEGRAAAKEFLVRCLSSGLQVLPLYPSPNLQPTHPTLTGFPCTAIF